MTTTCRIQLLEVGLDDDEQEFSNENAPTLYRHGDGYPSSVIPDIQKTYKRMSKVREGYCRGRAGKVASYLCATRPGEYEPEQVSGQELTNGINFLYKLYLINTSQGSMAENPAWELEISNDRGCFQPRAPLEECVLKCRKGEYEDEEE